MHLKVAFFHSLVIIWPFLELVDAVGPAAESPVEQPFSNEALNEAPSMDEAGQTDADEDRTTDEGEGGPTGLVLVGETGASDEADSNTPGKLLILSHANTLPIVCVEAYKKAPEPMNFCWLTRCNRQSFCF